MPSSPTKPTLYCKPGGIFALSGPGLQEFLRAVVAKGAAFRFRARGFSMHPFIQDGDVVTVSSYDGRRLETGEVVAFCHPETQKLIIHRVIARPAGRYLIRGDSSSAVDGLIPSENILGMVTRVERHGKQIRFTLGPERRLIAFLSRHNLLHVIVPWTWRVFRPVVGRLCR